MSIDYYDREGQPLEREDAWRLMEDYDYTKLKDTYLGEGAIWISTVWLGLNHGWDDGPPVIFESMVFGDEKTHEAWTDPNGHYWPAYEYRESLDEERYCTEEEALAGHERLVEKWTAKLGSLIDVLDGKTPNQIIEESRDTNATSSSQD
jgi:hypothetical protein